MKRFYKFLMPLVAIVAMALPLSVQAQDVSSYTLGTGIDSTKWVTLSSSATAVSAIYDDDAYSSVMNIGFTFQFAGMNYTQWSCNSNGRIALGATAVDNWWVNPFTPSSITDSRVVFPLIAALGMDNTLGGSGVWCKYEVVGAAPNRTLVIEYRTPSEYDEDGALVNYQIQFDEGTNVVRFVYGATAASYYDEFQAGMANAADDAITVSSTHTAIIGPTTTTLSAWPGVGRYYEFTPPTSFCARGGSLAFSNVLNDGFTVSWAPATTATSYFVYLNETEYITTDTFYTFTALDAMTNYAVSVRALCASGDTSGARTASVRTACGYITLPYQNGFEDEPYYSNTSYANAFPNCWTRINDASGTINYYPYITTTSSYVHNGTKGMYWYLSTTSTYADNEYAVLPAFDPTVYDITDLYLSFYAKTTATVAPWPQFIVGVMEGDTAVSTFVPVDTITLTSAWTMYAVNFADYTGTGNYIAIRSPRTTAARYMGLDDIYLTDEWCDAPANVTATATSDSVTVSWGGNGGTSFTVILEGVDTVINVTDTFYTFTDLNPNTLYNYSVANECSNGNSFAIGGSIRTDCVADTIPQTWNFDNMTSSEAPLCFSKIGDGSATVSTTYAHSGSKSLRFYGATGNNVVVLPALTQEANTLQLTIWTRPESFTTSSCGSFSVGYVTNANNASSFVALQTYNYNDFSAFAQKVVNYANAPEGARIALRHNATSSSWYWFVDDITVEPIPNCPGIDNLEATTTVGAALLTWGYQSGYDAPASYEVTYVAGDGTSNTVTVNEPNAMLTGLTAATSYRAYVRANCGSDGYGSMDSVDFTTDDFGCLDLTETQFSNSTTGISGCLAYSSWGNTAYQAVWTADELTAAGMTAGPIRAIDLGFTASTSYDKEFTIFIDSTSESSFSNATMIVPTAASQVYGPAAHPMGTAGWQHYEFTTPFVWDGTSNIVITTFMNQPTGVSQSSSSGLTGYYVSAANKARFRYKDSQQWTLTTLTTGSSGSTYSYRAAIHFYVGDCMIQATCADPALAVVAADTNSVDLAWIPGANESAWDLDYRQSGATTWTNVATGLSVTNYTISPLLSGTDYEFRISHMCDTVTYSSTVEYTTSCVPQAIPYTENFDSYTSGGFINCWDYVMTGTSSYQTGSYLPKVYSSTYASSGTNCLWLYGVGLFSLPEMSVSLDSLQMTFKDYTTSTSYGLIVGVMEGSMFVPIDTVELIPSMSNPVEVVFSGYHGDSRIIAFKNYYTTSSSIYYSYHYIDDIVVDYLPSCPHVTNVHTQYASGDTLVIAWTAGGQEEEWDVFDGTTHYSTTVDSIMFTELSPSHSYTYEVRAVCGPEDTSTAVSYTAYTGCGFVNQLPLVEDFEHVATGTSSTSSAFTVPCWIRLNNGTSYGGYPYVYLSSSYNHTPGGYKCAYWYGSTTTGTYGDYYIVELPPTDSILYPVNNLQLTFWAKATSTSYSPIFFAGIETAEIPENDSSFVYYDTIYVNPGMNSTEWQKYTVMFNNYDGVHGRVAIRANRPGSTWYVAIDDITLDVIPACPAVENVSVAVSPTSAIVSWESIGDTYTAALVEYRDTLSSTYNTVTVTGQNYAVLTGLTSSMVYDLRVSAVCTDVNSAPVTTTFKTSGFGCLVADTTTIATGTIGTGNSQTTGVPVNTSWGNTLCQSIYLASELNDMGIGSVITDIAYTWTTNSTYAKEFSIYMTNTTASEFTSATTSQWQPTGNATLVYSGAHNIGTTGTVVYHLTTPFVWDGSSNICITTTMNQPSGVSHSSSGFYGISTQTSASRSMYKYQDSNPLDGSNPASVSPSATSTYRPNITLTGYGCSLATTCAAPVAMVTDVTTNSVSIVWARGNTETSWNLYYRPMSDDNFTLAATGVTVTNYTFSGLASGTAYEFKIENVCADGTYATTVQAATECAAISSLPYTENFNNWGTGTGVIPACWSRFGSYSTYTYISATYNMTGSTGGSIYMYSSSGSSVSRLTLPELNTSIYPVNQTQLVFHAMFTSTNYGAPQFEVGVMTDPLDINSFVPVDTVQHSGVTNQWDIFEVPLSGYTDSGAYIGIRTLYPGTYTYFYLDNVTLELIPTCVRPDSLYAMNGTTNTVDFGWHERGNATEWLIEYGPRGFQPGTGTVVTATSNPFTLTGLPPAYEGEYYVRALCGAGDTSDYSRQACEFNTAQIPATLPYNYDFENGAEWDNWQTNSNSETNNWYRGTAVADSGSYAMYVSADAGTTYEPYSFTAVVNAAAYRDIDFGPVDSSYTLKFRARAGGTISASYDGLMVFLVDPALPTVASTSGITSPWGNVNNLYRIATVRLDTTWQTYTASFDTISGVHRVAFFWFNQNTGGSYANIPQPAAVDNIHIDYSSCPRPVSLEAVPSTTSALLTWQGPANATYEITYREVSGANQTVVANTNNYTLTGLTSPAEYLVWVRKLCGAGDTSMYSDGVRFTTLCAPMNLPYVETFNTTAATTYSTAGSLPLCWEGFSNGSSDAYFPHVVGSGSYWYSNDNTNALTLTSGSSTYGDTKIVALPILNANLSTCTMSFYYRMESTSYGDLEVGYFTGYDLENDFVPVDTMTRTTTITLDSVSFAGIPATAVRLGFRWIHDASYYSVGIDNITVTGSGAITCANPTIDTVFAGETTATLNWTGSAPAYEVAYAAGAWVEPTVTNPTTAASYTLTGLTPGTPYAVGVRSVCDSNVYSDWYVINITTIEHPCIAPTSVTVPAATIDYTSAVINWTPAEADQNDFEVRIVRGADTAYFEATGTSYTATGLVYNTDYTVAVRAICGEGNYSDWSDAANFRTAACTVVIGVTVNNVTSNSATVTWSGNAGSYEVAYGLPGTSTDDCESVTTTSTTATLTGLTDITTYVVYVRSVCGEGVYSDWSTGVQFTTEMEDPNVHYYDITVTVNDPAMGTATGSGRYAENSQVEIRATSNTGYHFVKWQDNVTDSVRTITVTANATYTATFAANGTQGIEDVEGAAISLYPNPASSTVTLSGIEGAAKVTVVDMNGREVYKTQTLGNSATQSLTIDVSQLAQGAYFVRITGERVNAIRKLIVR